MDANRITYLYENPREATEADLRQLNEVLTAFPYAPALHILHAKIMKQQNSYQFQDMLRKAALYAPDREVLEKYIEGEIKKEDGGLETEEAVASGQSTIHSPQSTVHSPQSTVNGPQSTKDGGKETIEPAASHKQPEFRTKTTVHSPQSTERTEDSGQEMEKPETRNPKPASLQARQPAADIPLKPETHPQQPEPSNQNPLKEDELDLEHLPERVRNLILKSREVRQKVQETRKTEGLEKTEGTRSTSIERESTPDGSEKTESHSPEPRATEEGAADEKAFVETTPEEVPMESIDKKENHGEDVPEISLLEERVFEEHKPEQPAAPSPEKGQIEERTGTFKILDTQKRETPEPPTSGGKEAARQGEAEGIPDFLTWLKRTKEQKTEGSPQSTVHSPQKPATDASDQQPATSGKHELIDRFIEKQPNFKPRREDSSSINMAELSFVDESAYVTETLARIYAEQKHYDKAINAYEILRLKYPEKSSFFADRILEIKKRKQNR